MTIGVWGCFSGLAFFLEMHMSHGLNHLRFFKSSEGDPQPKHTLNLSVCDHSCHASLACLYEVHLTLPSYTFWKLCIPLG